MRNLISILLGFLYCGFLWSQQIDVQGHRGCRGLYPENSIEAFVHAYHLGVNTLELDVVISADNQVVVSHEPYMSGLICWDNEGNNIGEEEETEFNLYKMDYSTIRDFSCGGKAHDLFTEQKKIRTYKPLLQEVYDTIEALSVLEGRYVSYNVEIKRHPKNDGRMHPVLGEFVDLVLEVVNASSAKDRTIIQSFDLETLRDVREKQADIPLALLVANLKGICWNLRKLGFTPEYYSPFFKLVSKKTLRVCERKQLLLLPWTVNEEDDIRKMLDLGVNGIISDYPDRVISLIEED